MTDAERDDAYRQLRERVIRLGEELIAQRKEIEALQAAVEQRREVIEAIGQQLPRP
jgi:nitrogen fixation/metabolism regulation signal transduction histidine kinase